MWNLNHDPDELTYETDTDSQTQRSDLWLPRGKKWMDGLGVWMDDWEDGWMDDWEGGWMADWVDEWMTGSVDGWMDC